jgi:hypothetical protein
LSWNQQFFDPIELPGGRKLVTLRDAALYITNLPKAEHDAEEWQAAMAALLLVAEHDGPTMFARIGVMRALTRLRMGTDWQPQNLSESADADRMSAVGQTEKHSERADVVRSSPKSGRWFSRPKHYADRTLWRIRRTTALRQKRTFANVDPERISKTLVRTQ